MEQIRLPEAIETERLLLRRWTEADIPALYEAVDASRERVGRWMPWVAYYTGPEAAATFIARAQQTWLTGAELPLAVTDKVSGRILGGCGFHSTHPGRPLQWDHRVIETGYWLRDGEEGKGYMREAVRAEIRLAVAHWGMESILIRADARNRSSRRIPEALGFNLDIQMRNDQRDHHGELRDTCLYSLLRREALPLIERWSDEPFAVTWSERPPQRLDQQDEKPKASSEPAAHGLPRPMLIETPRLILRPPELDDADAFFALLERSRASFERWLGGAARIRTRDDARDVFAAAIADGEAKREFSLVAFERSSGELVGGGLLHEIDWKVPSAEIDWWLDDRQTGKGFATEIGAAQLRFVMEAWRANRAHAWCNIDNHASRRVAERIGFRHEGTIRQEYSFAARQRVDFAIYSVIPPDYERLLPALPAVRFETD
jgi:RimJ/RimL family protein N-acetyltransferase